MLQTNAESVQDVRLYNYPCSEIRDIPMGAFVTVDISARCLPLRKPIRTISDPRERRVDIIVEGRLVANINFVPVRMRECSSCVPDLRTARDDERSDARSVLERDDTVDCAREDALVGRTGWDVTIGAATSGGCRDAVRDETRLGLGLG